jgi:predicted TIM-barrel fold metal-dependent hydrolase
MTPNTRESRCTTQPAQPTLGDPRRRTFLGSIAALGAGALFPGCASVETGSAARRIDVHHHIAPPAYSAALKSMMRAHAAWSVQASLGGHGQERYRDCYHLAHQSRPAGLAERVAGARKIARESNEYAARLVRDHPGRFGSFASIPFPDIEGCMREIEYALDTLKADGIYLWTSYGGKLLGDPAFFPILEELNRRKVVVYTHPATPACCANIMPWISINAIEGPVDTTRTMISLVFQGGAARYPDIRWIFSHSGGVTPFLLSRFERHMIDGKDAKEKAPMGPLHELKKFYYDTAQGNHPGALAALTKLAPISQIVYGTDFPFRDGAEENAGLGAHGFSAADMRAINRENALRLLPGLKA